MRSRGSLYSIVLLCCCGFATLAGGATSMNTGDENLWELSLEQLQKLKITSAAGFAQTPANAPSVVTVVTAHEIRNMGAKTIEEALRGVTGLDMVAKSYQPLAYIGVRGLFSTGSNNKIKIMVDGHMLQSAVGDPFFHINSLPIENIKQIEIIRGPGSALYGTNAFIGVLNIITQDGSESNRLTASGGSFKTAGSSLQLSARKKKLSTYFYADFNRTDGPSRRIQSDISAVGFGPQFSAAPGYSTESNQYQTFQTKLGFGNFYFNGFYQTLKTECAVGVFYALTDEDDIRSDIGFGQAGYELPLFDLGKIKIQVYGDYYNYNGFYETQSEESSRIYSEKYPDNPFPSHQGINLRVRSNLIVTGTEMTAELKPWPALHIVTGGSHEYIDQYKVRFYNNANLTGSPISFEGVEYQPFQYYGQMRDVSDVANWNQDATRRISAIYSQATIDFLNIDLFKTVGDVLQMTVGARYDDYSDMGNSLSPRLGLVYAPDPKIYFKVLYGEAFRAPFFHELFQASNSVTFGNVDLQPENINTFEVLTGYQFTPNINGSITYFTTRVTNLILRDAQRQYNNFGQMLANGIEMEMRFKYTTSDYGYLNATFQNVQNTTHEQIDAPDGSIYSKSTFYPGNVPAFIGNIGINRSLSKQVNLNLSLNYTSARRRSEEKSFDAEGNLMWIDNREPMEGRVLITTSVLLRQLHPCCPGLSFQITGYNLLNVDHRDPGPVNRIDYDIPRAGRHFWARLAYTF